MGNCVLRVIHIVDKFMEVFSALILGGMTLFIFAQVLARYVFKSPLPGLRKAPGLCSSG